MSVYISVGYKNGEHEQRELVGRTFEEVAESIKQQGQLFTVLFQDSDDCRNIFQVNRDNVATLRVYEAEYEIE